MFITHKLKSCMLIQPNYDRFIEAATEKKHTTSSTRVQIAQPNPLFWCFYILKNGYTEYVLNTRTPAIAFQTKTQEKFKYAERIRMEPEVRNVVKKGKRTSLKAMSANVVSENMTLPTFITLCEIYALNVAVLASGEWTEYRWDARAQHGAVLFFSPAEVSIEIDVACMDEFRRAQLLLAGRM